MSYENGRFELVPIRKTYSVCYRLSYEQKFYFTERANNYIQHQIRDLDIVFETYGVKPKGSIVDKIRKLL